MLSYSPDNGNLVWRERPANMFRDPKQANAWNGRFAGKHAGRLHPKGYIHIGVAHKVYQAHHLAWAIYYGEHVPSGMQIDHINCDPADNRISNLRLATSAQNKCNRRAQKNKTSQYKGVSFVKSSGRWAAYIKWDGNQKNLGTFSTEEEAYAAYCDAAKKLHGDFFHA